jgi:peroxiredoxin
MNTLLIRLLFLSLLSLPAFADLHEAEPAPQFATLASFGGKSFSYSLADSLKKGPVVVYFYPTAFGGGCSLQARAFAQNYEKFTAAGASIVGVSLDDIGRLNEFSAHPDFCASKFPVASDTEGKIIKAYGLSINEKTRGRKDNRGVTVEHGSIDRTTFIVGTDGKVITTLGGFTPTENVEKSLAAVQKIAAVH